MRRLQSRSVLMFLLIELLFQPSRGWTAAHEPMEGFVAANGVQLQYLEWGSGGPTLILVHGLGENPHKFDDLAPEFATTFHVIAYARRGAGGSELHGPYDVDTLTQDLLSLMDALGIKSADFVGHSAGGNEITELAVTHPERVHRIVYLDAGYDWADPDFKRACADLPFTAFDLPADAMSSWPAYRAYEKAIWYAQLDDMGRIDAQLRDSIVIQPDGTVKDRIPKDVQNAHSAALQSNKPRDYAHVHVPVLAIYAEHLYDPDAANHGLVVRALAWERRYWIPFQKKSIARVQNEIKDAQVLKVGGVHGSFLYTKREQVTVAVRRFLTSQ